MSEEEKGDIVIPISEFRALQSLMRADQEYAWAWHCNIAVPLMDSLGVSHKKANVAAAYLMSHLFGIDITTHPQFRYTKGNHQAAHEFLMVADGR